MPLPIDNLTTTHLDAATDDPSQARAELLAGIVKIKELIAAISVIPGADKILASDALGNIQLGNIIGIGTAPDTNHDLSFAQAGVEIGENALIYSRSDSIVCFIRNAKYVAGNWVYRSNGSAQMMQMEIDGACRFYTAPSGSAGATISFTPRFLIPPTIPANFVEGGMEYLESDVGGHSNIFDVDASIGAAWESVGPTGSGATNIWTALDAVPTGAKWIEVKIEIFANTMTSFSTSALYARRGGSSTSFLKHAQIAYAGNMAAGATQTIASNQTTGRIPLNSARVFDLYFSSAGTGGANMILAGFGL